MKTIDLTQLVTATRETSERLTEALKWIGIEVKTHYWYFEMKNLDGTNRKWEVVDFPPLNKKEKSRYFPAYTVTDCLAVLPKYVIMAGMQCEMEMRVTSRGYEVTYVHDDGDFRDYMYGQYSSNPAEALALLAIKGIEEGWITCQNI